MDSNQDTTLFQLIPISAPSISGIPYGSYVRIQHVLTACWMHASNGEEKDKGMNNNPPYFNVTAPNSARIPVVMPQATLSPSSSLNTRSESSTSLPPPLSISQAFSNHHSRYNSMSTLIDDENDKTPTAQSENESESTQYRISASLELYYHDCFSITLVDKNLSNTFNIANEMLPQLQWYLGQTRYAKDGDPYPIHDSEYESIISILVCTVEKNHFDHLDLLI